MYIICLNGDGCYDGGKYYTGNKYIYQGEKFAIFDSDINKAKKYKSFKRVESDCASLERTCTNCDNYFGGVYIEEIEVNE